ncbi:unnamed protein product [Mycena citricolor]|uniref:Uncharacterized protein n=1 Tax=Mycena citricolor TaxID=2018698 RepID=A0AAD2Q3F3_9AGAR|nr:unnamed protein product [Mycena citricolor]
MLTTNADLQKNFRSISKCIRNMSRAQLRRVVPAGKVLKYSYGKKQRSFGSVDCFNAMTSRMNGSILCNYSAFTICLQTSRTSVILWIPKHV